MKSKLLISLLLLLSHFGFVFAQLDSFEDVTKFSLSVDAHGCDKWYYKEVSTCVPKSVDAQFASQYLSRGMMQEFKNVVGSEPYRHVKGLKVFRIHTGQNNHQPVSGYRVYKPLHQTIKPVAPEIIIPKVDHSGPTIAATVAEVSSEIPVAKAATSFAKEAATSSAKSVPTSTATVATSKIAQSAMRPAMQHGLAAAATLAVGTVLYAGMHQAFQYMQPKQEIKLTYFDRAKLALSNCYTAVSRNVQAGYKLALENKGKTAGGLALVAAVGYLAYKNKETIFGKSKVNHDSDAACTPIRITFKPATRHLKD